MFKFIKSHALKALCFALASIAFIGALLCAATAAIPLPDSATTVNAVSVAGQVASGIAQASGNTETASLIQSTVSAILIILSYIFGHRHGKAASK
jgi:hypothetical protein